MTCPAVQDMADAGEEFAKAFYKKTRTKNLVLVGNSGCGKTHTAKRLYRWAIAHAFLAFDCQNWRDGIPSVSFVSWAEVTEGYYAGQFEITGEIIAADLLFIDDLGAERDPKILATDKLCQVLSRREKKFTVVTTNIQPDRWVIKWDERIGDRLLRNTRVVDLSSAPSYAVLQH